ncbi:DUF3488 and DUF4129 domain-containing transglutaminase family protein [Undibacterium arcticum]|uniref:DUF3488 and DUF4129 domain-containing transglutaminase family protein n=1 Tax=Undibacterium arcticum TaxID=1762892 RepID=A0ABV7EWR8_9BURK
MSRFKSAAIAAISGRFSTPLARDKADTLLLMLACVLVLLPHTAHQPLWISVACGAILCWRGWITWRGKRMPPRWLLLPVALAAMVGVNVTFKTLLGRDAGVAMLVLLLTFKLLEMHAKRDLFVVIFLSFFLMLASFFYSQTMLSALLTVVAVITMLTAQLSFQYTGRMPPLRRRLRLTAVIVGLAVPLTLVLFLLFPRIQGPLWGLPGDAHAGRSGLSDSMSPGNISQLALSEEIAFRVKFIDPAPPKSRLYWRGAVLGNYDGRSWTPMHFQSAGHQGSVVVLRPYGKPIRHQVTLEPNGQRWLFALELPRQAPNVDGMLSRIGADRELLGSEAIEQRIRYDAVSYPSYTLDADASPDEQQNWLSLPADYNPRTLAFAAKLHRQASDQRQLVNLVLQYFRRESFRYTLEPPPLGKHAVDEFLFSTRAGFCEHYASSFVVLMRALGIPARVVTGYQGGEMNPIDGYMTIRQSDAHAWAEVWLPQRGWLRVDPTAAVAPERVELNLRGAIPRHTLATLLGLHAGQDSWGAGLGLNWDAMTNSWNQWVLNYNPQRQRNLLRSLGFDDLDWQSLTALMFGLGTIAIALAALPLLLNRPRRDPFDAIYSAFCQQMARRGTARAIHEGPRAYAARLKTSLPADKVAAAERFLMLYEHIRFGSGSTAHVKERSAALARLKSHLADCR